MTKTNPELSAMVKAVKLLEPLTYAERETVLDYLTRKYAQGNGQDNRPTQAIPVRVGRDEVGEA